MASSTRTLTLEIRLTEGEIEAVELYARVAWGKSAEVFLAGAVVESAQDLAVQVREGYPLWWLKDYRSAERCRWCGDELFSFRYRKRRKFCSDRCRVAAWRAQRAALGSGE